MTRHFLGIDIGGTKSHALIANESGYALGFGLGGPGNHESIGWGGFQRTLHAVTDQALAAAGIHRSQIAAAGLGISGYDWPIEREPTRQVVASLTLDGPFEFVNDAVIGLIAGAEQGWGVVVVAGTGCNCRGKDQSGREGRVIGRGSWAGEYGGASGLVNRAIQFVAQAWTRRGPPTALTEAFMVFTGAQDALDLLEGLDMGRYHLSAADAPLIFQVAAQGDSIAQELIIWAGQELGSLAIGVINQLEFHDREFDVILTGNLFSGSAELCRALAATIHPVAPGARLVRLRVPPVVGGVLMAMAQVGIDPATRRGPLIESTGKLLQIDHGSDNPSHQEIGQ